MKVYIAASLLISFCCACLGVENEISLKDHFPGLLNSYEIVRKAEKQETQVPAYLNSLKRTKLKATPTSQIRYELARHLLDCHHLCYALYHQTYDLDPDSDIMIFAEELFPGLKKNSMGEGGIRLSSIKDYFDANPELWKP